MGAGIFSLIKSIFKPAADLVDNIHTSKEENIKLVKELAGLEFNIQEEIIEYKNNFLQAMDDDLEAEVSNIRCDRF